MVDLSVDNVFAANNAMELRAYYIAEKAKIVSQTAQNLTLQFTDSQIVGLGVEDYGDWVDNLYPTAGQYAVQFGTAAGIAAFAAVQTILDDYLDAKIAEQEAILTSLGVTY